MLGISHTQYLWISQIWNAKEKTKNLCMHLFYLFIWTGFIEIIVDLLTWTTYFQSVVDRGLKKTNKKVNTSNSWFCLLFSCWLSQISNVNYMPLDWSFDDRICSWVVTSASLELLCFFICYLFKIRTVPWLSLIAHLWIRSSHTPALL